MIHSNKHIEFIVDYIELRFDIESLFTSFDWVYIVDLYFEEAYIELNKVFKDVNLNKDYLLRVVLSYG